MARAGTRGSSYNAVSHHKRGRLECESFLEAPALEGRGAGTSKRSKRNRKRPVKAQKTKTGLPSAFSLGIAPEAARIALTDASKKYADNLLEYLYENKRCATVNEAVRFTEKPPGACKIGPLLKTYVCFSRNGGVPERIFLAPLFADEMR